MQKNKLSSFFNKLSVWSTLLVPVVALLGFIPIAPLGIDGTKIIIGGALVVLALVGYITSSYINTVFVLPNRTVLLGSAFFVTTYVISSFFTSMPMQSLFGLGIEMWTGTALTLFVAYFLLVSIHAQDASVRQMFVRLLLGSALIAVLFQVLRWLSLGMVRFNIFQNDITLNTVGRWFDFGFVAATLALAALTYVVTRSGTVAQRIAGWVVVVIGLIGACMVASLAVTCVLAIGASFVYMFARTTTDNTRHDVIAKIIAGSVALVAFAFFAFQVLTAQSPLFFQGSQVPNLASTQYNIAYRDYPTTFFGETLAVLKPILITNSVFGTGLNQFDKAWTLHKSPNMNAVQNTQWWATDFAYGFGVPLTMLGMTGILGLLGVVGFLGSIAYVLHAARSNTRSMRQYVIVLLSVLGLMYVFVHTPSAGLFFILLTVWGLAVSYGSSDVWVFSNTRNNMIMLGCVLLVVLVPVYGFASRTLSLSQGILALQTTDTLEGVANAAKKIEVLAKKNIHSTYYQSLATLEQIQAGQIANKIRTEEKTLSESAMKSLTTDLTQSYENAGRALRNAIVADPNNYNVYIQQAQFLGALAQLPAESDKEKLARDTRYKAATSDLEKARALAPQNPNIDVLQAQLDVQQNNYKEAQGLLLKAIEKRPAFTDPALLLAQLYAQQNNLTDARTAAQYAVRTNTSNPQALYVYGQLEKEAKNYVTAAQAFERIVALQGNNVSPEIARLLADTYVAAGALSQAKVIYEQILKVDPKNTDVEQILIQIQETIVQSDPVLEKPAATPKKR